MAAPAAALHLAVTGARWLGALRMANALSRRRLLLRTSVARHVEWLISTELLELPSQAGDCVATYDALAETIAVDVHLLGALRERLATHGVTADDPALRRRFEQALAEYAVARSAAAEVTTALLTVGTGALTFGKLTPGVVSFGPTLASIVAQQAAISSFPLGAGIGALW